MCSKEATFALYVCILSSGISSSLLFISPQSQSQLLSSIEIAHITQTFSTTNMLFQYETQDYWLRLKFSWPGELVFHPGHLC